MIKAVNIIWDTDDEETLKELPTEIDIPHEIEDDDDKISDYLSDETGFCHKGYLLKRITYNVEITDKNTGEQIAWLKNFESHTGEYCTECDFENYEDAYEYCTKYEKLMPEHCTQISLSMTMKTVTKSERKKQSETKECDNK